jgi:ubiquinol-cytochrome c reductase cytochrome c1 subunit
MPHALWQLQGKRAPIYETVTEHGQEVHVFKAWEQLTPGTMSPEQYDQTVGDLVNYLQWMAEPAANTRVRLGFAVLAFLLVLTFFTYRMNAAFWKEVK